MKKVSFVASMIIGFGFFGISQNSNNFNVEKFEKELVKQMEIQFPGLTLDTTLRFATRARSSEEAGHPECYASKRGGMVNTSNNKKAEAIKLVTEYKKYINDVLYFNDAALKRCRFTEFCATATEQYGGLVRYGIVIDNNITRESLINSSKELLGE